MNAGILLLGLAYVLSQFFRAFLAVLTPVLKADLGATPQDLAFASGLWFLVFAAMQIPVGWALDTLGPRRTAAWLLAVGGGGGALVFAAATSMLHINIAMALIGIGCSPVLMASYYIFAQEYPPARFATLAALMLGLGSVGNLIASYPMALAASTIGWRAALVALAMLTGGVAIGLLLTVRDPAKADITPKGSVLDLLRMPVLWLIFPLMFVNYAPSGALRGLWIGPYLSDVHGLDTGQIGQATLMMGLAMIAGTLAFGPLDRLFGTRKWIIVAGNAATVAMLVALVLIPATSAVTDVALMAATGFFGATFPIIIAHARSFFPPHLTGRGVTLLNLFGIGGVGLMQLASGRIHAATDAIPATAPYNAIFLFFAISLALGIAVYLFSRDSTA